MIGSSISGPEVKSRGISRKYLCIVRGIPDMRVLLRRFVRTSLPAAAGSRQTAGLSGLPKTRQRLSGLRCGQRTPAGFPSGMSGMGDEIDSAIQHAPQPILQFM
jgi:hypothetical protein